MNKSSTNAKRHDALLRGFLLSLGQNFEVESDEKLPLIFIRTLMRQGSVVMPYHECLENGHCKTDRKH